MRKRCDETETERIYERMRVLDEQYRREEPYVGDKDNMMSKNVYQSYCMFELYEAMERKLTTEDLQELTDIYFGQSMAHMPKNLSFGTTAVKFWAGLFHKYLAGYAARANARKGGEWSNTWGVKVNPDGRETGLAFNLAGCPLADFARKHDMMNILPFLCNIDHRTAEAFGMKLFRDKTVSNGDSECVYWIVSQKSKEADSFVNEKNQAGLILSHMK